MTVILPDAIEQAFFFCLCSLGACDRLCIVAGCSCTKLTGKSPGDAQCRYAGAGWQAVRVLKCEFNWLPSDIYRTFIRLLNHSRARCEKKTNGTREPILTLNIQYTYTHTHSSSLVQQSCLTVSDINHLIFMRSCCSCVNWSRVSINSVLVWILKQFVETVKWWHKLD